MSDDSSISASIEQEAETYRASMAGFLRQSLVIMNDLFSTVDFDELVRPIVNAEFTEDHLISFRQSTQLLIAKARLHVKAALDSNTVNNIHSLAVQMRPALECAGQVVLILESLLSQSSSSINQLYQYLESDFYQTMKQQSKGQIDQDGLLERISAADPRGKASPRKPRTFREAEKVKSLEFGEVWFRHLSGCFFHSDMAALKEISFFGGVSSCNTMHDQYAFASLLDYLAHQVLVMLMAEAVLAAMPPDGDLLKDERVEKAMGLLQKKSATSDQFREVLMSMATQRNQ